MTPGQVLVQHPEWKSIWYDSPDGQYGRPAAFYQQLQALNLGAIWQQIDAPVLVLRGTNDTIMSRAGADAIVDTVNRVHPGRARYLEIDGMTHGFVIGNKFHAEIIQRIIDWMKSNLQ